MTSSLYEIREEINDTEVRDHLEKLVQLMLRKEFLRVWALADKEYEQHIDLQKEKLRLLKTEFEGIKDDLAKHGDKYVDKYIGPERSCTVCFISSGPKRRSRYKLPRQVCFISISPQSVVDHISGRGRILQTILSSF